MDADDLIFWILGVVLVGILLACFVMLGYVVYDTFTGTSCKNQAEAYGFDYKYKMLGGCFVETPEFGWVVFEQYQNMLTLNILEKGK